MDGGATRRDLAPEIIEGIAVFEDSGDERRLSISLGSYQGISV
jgi:hypothetical protein